MLDQLQSDSDHEKVANNEITDSNEERPRRIKQEEVIHEQLLSLRVGYPRFAFQEDAKALSSQAELFVNIVSQVLTKKSLRKTMLEERKHSSEWSNVGFEIPDFL